jgi:hypothetical protein
MKRLQLVCTLIFLAGLIVITGAVVAHEHREVGEYELTFGWRNEPAMVGFPNGPEVSIALHSEGGHGETEAGHDDEHSEAENPIAELEIALEVEVTFGPETRTIPLRAAFGEIGHFIADVIPTRPGDYAFRVFGTIGDLAVDETFNSADGGFSSVEPAGDVTFPDSLASLAELMERIAELESRLAALEGGA